MTKVSKNIRKIRTAKNLTQDELAQKLFVTRQTVSGWENGRTQPDIETLCRISEIFGVPVEYLIYGEKRFSTADEKAQSSKRTLIIIFSIIASVLMGTGLILIFFTYWENFPIAVKNTFSFLPMIVGQTVAVFTFLKHKDSVAWLEGSSVLWCAGCAATIALIYNIYKFELYHVHYSLFIALLFLPVIYFFNAVSPLPVYYMLTIVYSINMLGGISNAILSALTVAFFIAGYLYVLINRKNEDFRYIASQWLTVLASGVFLTINCSAYDLPIKFIVSILSAFFLCLYIADKKNSWTSPFKTAGILGIIGTSIYCICELYPTRKYSTYKIDKITTVIIIFAVLCILAVIIAAVIKRKNLFRQPLKASFCIPAFLLVVSQYAYLLFFPGKNHPAIYFLMLFAHFIMSVSLIAEGAITSNFLTLNVGLLSMVFLIGYVIFELVDINIFEAGILLVILGALLFGANYYIAKKGKNVQKGAVSDA